MIKIEEGLTVWVKSTRTKPRHGYKNQDLSVKK